MALGKKNYVFIELAFINSYIEALQWRFYVKMQLYLMNCMR